jgi:glucose-6-phosphate 1-dehydrogenase
VGVARRPLGDEFAADMRAGIVQFGGVDASDSALDEFVKHISYFPLKFDDPSDYAGLKTELDRVATANGIGGNRLFYLATAPEFFAGIVENLGAQGMAQPEQGKVGVVIEKPFGHDLESAKELNQQVNAVFHEYQVFRIDHYLGKETVQNILVFRFANGILSRYGTGITLTPCRLRQQRRWAWKDADRSTRRRERCGMWCRTM